MRQRRARESGHRGKDVHVAGGLVNLQAGRDHARPPHDAGDPDASFPVVGFSPWNAEGDASRRSVFPALALGQPVWKDRGH